MTKKKNVRPEGGEKNAPQVKMLLRYPVLNEAQAKKLKIFIAAHDIAGAARMIEKQGDVRPFSPALCVFFIHTFHQLYGALELKSFRPLAKLVEIGVGNIRAYGPTHPGWGLLCQTQILLDLVFGNWAAAMRRTLLPPPADSMQLVWGAPEMELKNLMRKAYPAIILSEAASALEEAWIHGKFTQRTAGRFIELAEATPPLVKNARRWSGSFKGVHAFLENLGDALEMADEPWADEMLEDSYARAVAAHCHAAGRGGDAESRLALLSLFSAFADPAPEVVRPLWESLWRAHEALAGKPGHEDDAALDELWAAGAFICDFLLEPDAFKDFGAALTKGWPGGKIFADILRLEHRDELEAARALEALLPQLKARVAKDPSDLLAGAAAIRLVAAAAGLAGRSPADETLFQSVDRLEAMVFELFGDVRVQERNPLGAWAVFILRNGDPFNGTEAQKALTASAELICRRLARAGRCGVKSGGAMAAVNAMLRFNAAEWVRAGDWERIYDVLHLDEEPPLGEGLRTSLFNCARDVIIARKIVEHGCSFLDEDDYWEDEAENAALRGEDLEDAGKAGLPADIRRLEADFAVCAEIMTDFPMDAAGTWGELGREAGTGISEAELRRLRVDEEALKAHLEGWIEAAQDVWRRTADSAAFMQVVNGEEEEDVPDDDFDPDDFNEEELRLLALAVECRAGVLQNYGDEVPFDFGCANPEMEELLLFVRPKAHPERLVCFCFAPVPLIENAHAEKRAEKIPRFALMCEAPATLLETPEGREDLRLLGTSMFAWSAALTTDGDEGDFAEDSAVMLSGGLFAGWRPFPSEKYWVSSRVPFDEEDAPGADEPRWVERDGERLARVVEVFLLTDTEAEWLKRAVTIGADRDLDLEKLRLRREHRPGAVDVCTYAGGRENRTLTVRLPKELRGRTCWVARSIMEGRGECYGFEYRGEVDDDDSGWLFVDPEIPFTEYLKLPLADVLNAIPEAAPHVTGGDGTVYRRRADGAGFEDISEYAMSEMEKHLEEVIQGAFPGTGSAQA